MRRQWILAGCIGLFYHVGLIGAQSDADSLAIEIAAARFMLSHQYNKGPISLDPAEGPAGHSPSSPGSGKLRSNVRTIGIAKAISGVVRLYSDVSACKNGQTKCALSGVTAHLVLSAATINGDSATVTATIYQNTPDKRQLVDYETVLLTVIRRTGSWYVLKEVQLGIS